MGKERFNLTGTGCYGKRNEYAKYSKSLTPQSVKNLDYLLFHEFGPFDVKIRSDLDPLVIAEEVTEGTLDFGLSSRDYKGMGFGFTIFFGLLILIPSYFIVEYY